MVAASGKGCVYITCTSEVRPDRTPRAQGGRKSSHVRCAWRRQFGAYTFAAMNLSGSPLASARSRTGARSRCHPCRWVLPPSPVCSPKRTCLARASGCAAALPRMFRSVPLACLLGVVYRTPGSISLLLAWSTSAAAADRSGLLIARASARGRLWPLLLSKGIAVATGRQTRPGSDLG